ncbi:MAG: hypothetical protein ACFB0B_09295 [Thermonemataceae bacterium]
MNIWEHCLLSQRKFGGVPDDYEKVHSFIDCSKYFYYHVKHRLLLHHLFGVELAVELMGNFIENSTGKKVLVRDIAIEHCREDLDGRAPTLLEWLEGNALLGNLFEELPTIEDEQLHYFVYRPFQRTGLKASLIITCSDLGIHLAKLFLGSKKATELTRILPLTFKVKYFLEQFQFTQRWQYTPQQKELDWLKKVASSK